MTEKNIEGREKRGREASPLQLDKISEIGTTGRFPDKSSQSTSFCICALSAIITKSQFPGTCAESFRELTMQSATWLHDGELVCRPVVLRLPNSVSGLRPRSISSTLWPFSISRWWNLRWQFAQHAFVRALRRKSAQYRPSNRPTDRQSLVYPQQEHAQTHGESVTDWLIGF